MIKMIFKQLWNQRKMNLWIFLEMLTVCFFLWLIIDPVYVLMTNKLTDRGYEVKGRYVVDLGEYVPGHGKRNDTLSMDMNVDAMLRIARIIRNCPEVESISLSGNNAFPNAQGYYTSSFATDTTKVAQDNAVNAQWFLNNIRENSDFFRTYGMKDARTGKDMVIPADITERPQCFISAELARKLFGSIEVVGKKIHEGTFATYEIAGVFEDYKHRDYEPPVALVVRLGKEFMTSPKRINHKIVFKIKDHVNTEAFENRFMKEIAPQLEIGNYYLKRLKTFEEVSHEMAKISKIYVKLNTKFSLAFFALLSIFLGTLGTFWVRCDERKHEIGVMRSIGASKSVIIRQYFIETGLLVTLAAVCILPVLLHYVYVSGMYQVGNTIPGASKVVWGLEVVPHFCMVYLFSYLIILLIALIGTYLPVNRALKVHPVEALREE